MAYAELSTSMQNLVLTGFELFGKLFLLTITFLVAVWYVLYLYGTLKKSDWIGIDISRNVLYGISIIYLALFPLNVILLYPTVGLDYFLNIMAIIYGVLFTLVLILITINLWYYIPLLVLRLAGVRTSRKASRVYRRVVTNGNQN